MEQPSLESLVSCPVCAQHELIPRLQAQDRTTTQEVFTLMECAHCGFLFTSPRPTPASIGRYYESEAYISHTNARKGLVPTLYQAVRRQAIRSKAALIARYHTHGNILDVGCGTGEFLAYLHRRGYQVSGVEPSAVAREAAIRQHALPVVPRLEQVDAHEQFHAITLWHVLEHVHDIHATLKQLYMRCRKDGVLLIAVPDRESWDAQHYGADWAAYDVPRHLSHFRRGDMRRVLMEHGFELLSQRRMWFDAPYVGLLSERHRHSGPVAFVRGLFFGTVSNLAAWLGGRPTSSTLFIARKT